MFYFKLFIITLIVMLALDYVWLSFVAKNFYMRELAPIGRISDGRFEVVMWAGLVVYIFMAAALVYFVWPRISGDVGWPSVFLNGAFLGLCMYAIYDFTNYATLKDWTLPFMAVDVTWGAFLGGASAVVLKMLSPWFSP